LKTILILSCSWGAGEWGVTESGHYDVLHPSLTEYLQGEYDALNLSQPGGDLSGFVRLFDKIIRFNPHKQFLPVLIQTDITRSFSFREFLINPGEKVLDFLNRFYLEIYKEFNDRAEKLGTTLYVIGGLTDVTVDLRSFRNLKLLSPSWCSLIDPSVPLTPVVDVEGIDYLNWKYQDRRDQLLHIIELADQRWKFFDKYPQFFQPDGQHPNRDMHRILADYLTNYFKSNNHV
jgi:hypothetical protein